MTGHARNELANFDPNMERYAFWDTNGIITVRTASNDLIEAVLSAPGYTFEWGALFSANGKYVGARYWREGEGESFWVWDLATQKVVIRAVQKEDVAKSADIQIGGSFSQDSRLFACFKSEGTISLYDLPSGKEIKHFPCNRLLQSITWDPANTRLAYFSREDPKVEIRAVESGQILRTLTCPAGVSAFAWSADGKRLATACMDFNIYVWDAETGRRQAVVEGHGTFIMSVAFNHAGNLLVSASYDGVVRLWNAHNGRQLAGYRGSSWQIHFSTDDRYLVGWQDGSRYGSLEVASSQECRQLYVPRDGLSNSIPAFSADGHIIALGTESMLCFWDASSGNEIGSFPLKAFSQQVFTPDGRSLLTVDRMTGIRQRTLEKVGASAYRLGKPRPFLEASDIEDVSLSLDGRHLAVTQRPAGQAFIFDLQNPAAKVVLSGHPLVDRIAISPDGRWAATASWHNPLVKIWDARSGDLLRSMTMAARTWVTFSPDSRWLATTSDDTQLWAVGSWLPKDPPKASHDGNQQSFTAFSPDGRLMARMEWDKIRLLETMTGTPVADLEAPGSSGVARCQFSPDGSLLAVVQVDHQVQLWDLRLIRQELAQMHLDWDSPPYPPLSQAFATGPVTLEVEPDPSSSAPAQGETNSTAHSF
jgi:WD40 repeat protein